MATKFKNLSVYDSCCIPSASKMNFGIVISEWNSAITDSLRDAALDSLKKHGASEKNIFVHYVPGSYELPMGAQYMASSCKNLDAIICIGCVIQGETRHFDFICNAVSNGILRVSLDYSIPVIFGVLTTNNLQQAKDRSGGKHGNKGDEAAITAIKMADLRLKLFKQKQH